MTVQDRRELIELLSGLLEEEHKLVTESDHYQRTSFTTTHSTIDSAKVQHTAPVLPTSLNTKANNINAHSMPRQGNKPIVGTVSSNKRDGPQLEPAVCDILLTFGK